MRSIRRHEWTQQRHQALKSIKCNRGVTNHKDNITKNSVLGFNLFDENKSWECTAKIELCQKKKEFWHMNALKSKKRGNIMCVFVCFSSWAEQTKTFFVCEWNEMNAGLNFSDKRPMKNEISSIETVVVWGAAFTKKEQKMRQTKIITFLVMPRNGSQTHTYFHSIFAYMVTRTQ